MGMTEIEIMREMEGFEVGIGMGLVDPPDMIEETTERGLNLMILPGEAIDADVTSEFAAREMFELLFLCYPLSGSL